jgi:hypothetical protein
VVIRSYYRLPRDRRAAKNPFFRVNSEEVRWTMASRVSSSPTTIPRRCRYETSAVRRSPCLVLAILDIDRFDAALSGFDGLVRGDISVDLHDEDRGPHHVPPRWTHERACSTKAPRSCAWIRASCEPVVRRIPRRAKLPQPSRARESDGELRWVLRETHVAATNAKRSMNAPRIVR